MDDLLCLTYNTLDLFESSVCLFCLIYLEDHSMVNNLTYC